MICIHWDGVSSWARRENTAPSDVPRLDMMVGAPSILVMGGLAVASAAPHVTFMLVDDLGYNDVRVVCCLSPRRRQAQSSCAFV